MSKSLQHRNDQELQQGPTVRPSEADHETAGGAADNASMAAQANAARGLGKSQAPLEAAFETDFSGVQVHRDGRADAMGAQAYAQGENIHLGSRAASADTAEGQALLGHEAAHVVQQRQGRVDAPQGKGAPVVADESLEAEADVAGAMVARGEPVPASLRGAGGSSGSSAVQGKAEGAPIQMFGALEHKTMGWS